MTKAEGNAAKRRRAKDLYCRNNLQQQAIAELVGVTEKTIGRWKQEDAWDAHRAAITTTKDSELARLYAQVHELNTFIEGRGPGQRYASSKEADILSKLSSAIRALEQDAGISTTVEVAMRFGDWLRTARIDTRPLIEGRMGYAQFTIEQFNAYIKGLMK